MCGQIPQNSPNFEHFLGVGVMDRLGQNLRKGRVLKAPMRTNFGKSPQNPCGQEGEN